MLRFPTAFTTLRDPLKFTGKITSFSSAHLGGASEASLVAVSDGVRIFLGVDHGSGSVPWRLFGLGSRATTAALGDVAVLVTEGNHCYNSHEYNTRTSPLVCEPQVKEEDGCPEVLDYSVATAANWVTWLEEDRDEGEGYVVTACNDVVLHGSWGGGSKATVDLFDLGGSGSRGRVGVLAAYESYKAEEESVCGTPVMGVDGVVVSSFAVNVHFGGYEGTQAGLGMVEKGLAPVTWPSGSTTTVIQTEEEPSGSLAARFLSVEVTTMPTGSTTFSEANIRNISVVLSVMGLVVFLVGRKYWRSLKVSVKADDKDAVNQMAQLTNIKRVKASRYI